MTKYVTEVWKWDIVIDISPLVKVETTAYEFRMTWGKESNIYENITHASFLLYLSFLFSLLFNLIIMMIKIAQGHVIQIKTSICK